MKKYYLLLIFLFSFLMGFAQNDSLSLEEQQRREKNIQAGNPFKKFGYKPKISTLSQGKYLEFHDLDSVVQIGSFTYHVKKKVITGFFINETRFSEATLRPEIISRWMSPDPLSEEFPSWSPYVFTNDNPIRFIDPTGLAPVDIVLLGANNSSVTIETDLINVTLDASSLVGDLGGNYSFSGDDILVAGLDIVGVFEPTPIADMASASIEANNGNWLGAALSGLGVVPYIGDIGKVGKIPKHVKTIENAVNSIKSGNKTDFVVTPKGEAIKIPDGATGPINPERGSGMMYQGGSGGKGMNNRTTGVRVMDANKNQGKRVNYMNKNGQTVDPKTGRTISNKDPRGHQPLKDY